MRATRPRARRLAARHRTRYVPLPPTTVHRPTVADRRSLVSPCRFSSPPSPSVARRIRGNRAECVAAAVRALCAPWVSLPSRERSRRRHRIDGRLTASTRVNVRAAVRPEQERRPVSDATLRDATGTGDRVGDGTPSDATPLIYPIPARDRIPLGDRAPSTSAETSTSLPVPCRRWRCPWNERHARRSPSSRSIRIP